MFVNKNTAASIGIWTALLLLLLLLHDDVVTGQTVPSSIQLGPRPYWLVQQMRENSVSDELGKCSQYVVLLDYFRHRYLL
jgi:hypothetical protein